MPRAAARLAVARPIGPGPPPRAASRPAARCADGSPRRPGPGRRSSGGAPVANASIAPITHSAIGSSNTPRAFVTTTSLSTSAGNSNPSTPAEAVWIHRSRLAAGQAAGQPRGIGAPREERVGLGHHARGAPRRPGRSGARRRRSAASMPGGRRRSSAPATTTTGRGVPFTAASGPRTPPAARGTTRPVPRPGASTGRPAALRRSAGKSTSPDSGSRSRMPSSARVVRSARSVPAPRTSRRRRPRRRRRRARR